MKKVAIIWVAIIFLITGCSKPQDVVIPTDQNAWQGDFAKQIKDLSDGDKQLLTGYLIRKKMAETFGGDKMQIGVTVGNAIEDQRAWLAQKAATEAAQAKLAQQLEEQKKATEAQLSKTVLLAFLSEEYEPANYRAGNFDDLFIIDIGIKNQGSKAIKGIKADLLIKNTFGEKISSTTLNIEQSIPAGTQVTWKGSRKLNQFEDEDKKLMNLAPGTFSTELRPVMIVYEDGTTVGTP